jgi:hypothetical protein
MSLLCAALLLAACNANGEVVQQEAGVPTNTLAPIVSLTPRFTATPVSSRTPLPTFTFTPSNTPLTPTPSNTPTPSATPPITGIIASLQTVNIREGPGVNYGAIKALKPGTGVTVLRQTEDGKWLNILMDDGTQGWIATSLLRINPTPTLIPTSTPTPNLTALAQGTPLPTAILGGGTITPTPPRSVATPTPIEEGALSPTPEATAAFELPVIDVSSIQETATALAGGSNQSGTTTQPTSTGLPLGVTATFTPLALVSGTPATAAPTQAGVGSEGNTTGSQQGVDVLAYCDNRALRTPPPTNLKSGATIDVFWSWYAKDTNLIQQHIDNAVYDVQVDGKPLDNWQQFRIPVRKQGDGNYYVYWFVPFGPLAAGPHTITYKVSWKAAISDGYQMYGPGTNKESETGTCTFTVQ